MRLFDPIRIRGLELANRIVMAPMTTRLAAPDGGVTDELVAYYEARARGGVGLILVELSSPHPSGVHRRSELGIHNDRFVGGLTRLVQALHRHGARVGIQIGHAGAHARSDVTGFEAVAPDSVPHRVQEGDTRTVRPRPLTIAELGTVTEWYAAAAVRLRQAGFDLVEIQGGHDYLLAQFLSPLDNRRSDEYGGSLAGRVRFPLEVTRAIRAAIGDLALGFRYSVDEFAPGGFSRDDGLALAPMLEAAGVDLIHVSGGSARSVPVPWLITTPMAYPPGPFVPLASAVRKLVRVPVAVANRLHDPVLAESVLEDGHADLIALGRALLADPDWPAKVKRGDASRIRPCIACNTCVDHLRSGRHIRCLVNPKAGLETEPAVAPTVGSESTALVVGGGPAGMTAAAAMAMQGRRVILCELQPQLGGRLRDIHRAPYFQVVETSPWAFEKLMNYLCSEVAELRVDVRTATRVDLLLAVELKPDLVVLADGARYPVPGMLELLGLPRAQGLASLRHLRKLFFKLLRPRSGALPRALEKAGLQVVCVGDRSGTRGVEAAIRTGTLVNDRRAGVMEQIAAKTPTPSTVSSSQARTTASQQARRLFRWSVTLVRHLMSLR